MLDCIFLIPIDYRGIQGKLFPQYLELQSWCEKNNSKILTCSGLFLNFARNSLATANKGYVNPTPPDAEWLFWIDSDINFDISQIEYMMSIPKEKKFVTGWYRSDYGDKAMVGNWDEDYFRKNLHMPFTSVEWLTKIAEEDNDKLVKVDWCGFGFTKVHRSIYEAMEYPYYPLNHTDIEGCIKNDGSGDTFHLKELSFEDISFCQNCYKTTGIKPLVAPKMRVGHLKQFLV